MIKNNNHDGSSTFCSIVFSVMKVRNLLEFDYISTQVFERDENSVDCINDMFLNLVVSTFSGVEVLLQPFYLILI